MRVLAKMQHRAVVHFDSESVKTVSLREHHLLQMVGHIPSVNFELQFRNPETKSMLNMLMSMSEWKIQTFQPSEPKRGNATTTLSVSSGQRKMVRNPKLALFAYCYKKSKTRFLSCIVVKSNQVKIKKMPSCQVSDLAGKMVAQGIIENQSHSP